jgi:uncharacterized membrane protein
VRLSLVAAVKPLVVAGILLAGLGLFIVLKGLTVHSTGTYNVGPFHGAVQERHAVPAWFGGVAIVGGVLLIFAGSRRK